eukprot:g10.t1
MAIHSTTGRLPLDSYKKSLAYSASKNRFGAFQLVYGFVKLVLGLYISPYLWSYSGSLLSASPSTTALFFTTSSPSPSPYSHAFVFSLFETLVSIGFSLPLSLYSTFVIEEKFGFNNHTLASFLKDQVKSIILGIVLSTLFMFPVIYLIDLLGKDGWFYGWIVACIVVGVVTVVYPTIIAPIFNKFTPLRPGPIRDSLERLIEDTGLPCSCDNIYEVDGSKQSSHSNAYVAGMCGTRRVVIYDTLIKDLDENVESIQSVVGHEIGHAMLNHTPKLLVMHCVNFLAMFYLFRLFQDRSNVLLDDFGYATFGSTPSTFLVFSLFTEFYSAAFGTLLGCCTNAVTRRFEYQADAYAIGLGFDLRGALLTIHKTNLSDANPDWLDSLMHHNHPSLIERTRYMTQLINERKKTQ